MLSRCCFCFPLRTGSIILATLGVLCGIVIFVAEFTLTYELKHRWPNHVWSSWPVLSNGFLLYGALRYNKKAVLASLVCSGIYIIVSFVLSIYFVTEYEIIDTEFTNNCGATVDWLKLMTITCDQYNQYSLGLFVGGLTLFLLIGYYFWICNYSFYKHMEKRGQRISVKMSIETNYIFDTS